MPRSKTILMVNDHLHFGGGGDAAFQLERQILEEQGHRVVAYGIATEVANTDSSDDILFKESSDRRLQKIGKFFRNDNIEKDLGRVVESLNPDFIKLHLLSKYPADMYKALKGYNATQVLHGPNLFCATGWGNQKRDSSPCEQGVGLKCWHRGCVSLSQLPLHLNLKRRNFKYLESSVRSFQSPSRHLAKTAESLGLSPVQYFPLSVDRRFESEQPQFSNSNTVLFVGALVEAKGIAYLIEAMKSVIQELPTARLKIAGRGVMQAQLQAMVSSEGLTNSVSFLGFRDREQVVQLYREADVVVMPSIWNEQFGLVGAEALACGVPVVGTDVGGISEWLDHEASGYLVAPRDSQALARRVVGLLGDRVLRERLGAYGRSQILKRFGYTQYKKNVLAQLDNSGGNMG